jgi:TolB-like protein/Tfp pilus assembly protein PilF
MSNAISKEITIAVIPFQVLSPKADLSPAISWLTEELVTNLSKFLGISVISQHSTQSITEADQEEAIHNLGADFFVTGSLLVEGGTTRIGVQLVRSEDHKVVFAQHYEQEEESFVSTQNKIIQQIVNVLQQQIDYNLLSYSYEKNEISLAAYEKWLIGMDHLKKGSPADDMSARDKFEDALSINPQYALAYTGISLSYFNVWSCQLWERWDENHNKAHEFALKAVDIDEHDYLALSVLGRTYLFYGEYDKAEHCLRKSLRMNPNDANNLIQISFSMTYLGFAEEARDCYLKAVRLNPLHGDLYFAYGSFAYFELGEYRKSVDLGEKVPKDKAWTDFPVYMAAAYYHLGDLTKTQEYWDAYMRLFKMRIGKGKEVTDQEALIWCEELNPYKGKTHLTKFFEEYFSNIHIPSKSKDVVSNTKMEASVNLKGELWEFNYQGESVLLKDAKGLHDIVRLIKESGNQIHCAELMDANISEGSSIETLDAKSKKDYRERLVELNSGIEEAENMGNSDLAISLREEYEALLDNLTSSLGLGGKARNIGSSVEKARSAVTWRIRSSIKKIEQVHPNLALHLSKSIKTGTFCSYQPELSINWDII